MDVVLDYVRMAFHVDLIFFNRMLREIGLHREAIDQMITALGTLESAVSIAMYRASLEEEGRRGAGRSYREFLCGPGSYTIRS